MTNPVVTGTKASMLVALSSTLRWSVAADTWRVVLVKVLGDTRTHSVLTGVTVESEVTRAFLGVLWVFISKYTPTTIHTRT